MRAAFSLVSLLILGLGAAYYLILQEPELEQLKKTEAATTPQPGQTATPALGDKNLDSKVARAVQQLGGQDAQAQVNAAMTNGAAGSP